MKRLSRFLLLFLLLVALTWPSTAYAKGTVGDRVIPGGSFTLRSGETEDGSLLVLGGNVTLEEGSTVNGDVVILGGNLTAAGDINGDVVIVGGNARLDATAVVSGDVSQIGGGNVDRDPDARVEGTVNSVGSGASGPFPFAFPRVLRSPFTGGEFSPFSILLNMVTFFLVVFLWAGLAVLVMMFLPNPVNKISQAALSQPLVAGGVGLLTAAVGAVILTVLAITICLIPISFVGGLAVAAGWVLGIIALGAEVGRRMGQSLNQDWAPPFAAGVGTFLLILIMNGAREVLPFVGWIVPALVGMLGLGAVLLTRFGTHPYPVYVPQPLSPLAAVPPAQAVDWNEWQTPPAQPAPPPPAPPPSAPPPPAPPPSAPPPAPAEDPGSNPEPPPQE